MEVRTTEDTEKVLAKTRQKNKLQVSLKFNNVTKQ
jgi:hypothetical protein